MIADNLVSIGTAVANHLWQSTIFAIAAAVLTLALRKNQARIRYRLWLAASLKFLIPFSLLIDLGARVARLTHTTEAQPDFYLVLQRVSQPFHESAGSRGLLASVLSFLPWILALLWLGGFAASLSLSWVRWRRVAAGMRAATLMNEGREVDALRRMETAAGVRTPIAVWSSPSILEPGIFGVFRPVLLWPAAISIHLQDAHLEAILAHELEHVNRRDNLAAAIHMLVEAMFWFHPLVWRVGAQLIEERERACDEAVLQFGKQPQIYAESILKTCEFCVSSPLACFSGVTGGNLQQRMVRIMTQQPADKLGLARKVLVASVGIVAVAGPIVLGLMKAPLANAQPSESKTASNANEPDKVYHVGGDVSAPGLVFAPDPKFSEQALRAKYQGACVVSLIVDAEGKPQRVQVVRHLGMGLDENAVTAVRQYKFTPAMRFGEPVAVEVKIEVNFRRY